MDSSIQSRLNTLIKQCSEIVLDKNIEIHLAVTCLVAGGHLLIEDVPGVGKTTLVQSIGKLSGLPSSRIQFTVDLLPADILGGQIFNSKIQEFFFHPGPIFHQLILADELNRASPRTQGALLQAMEEGQVSIDGKTHDLPNPFFVIATQNPHQQLGTFPLPESQLDRFLMSLELNYASQETEILLFKNMDAKSKIKQLKPILSKEDFLLIQSQVAEVTLADIVAKYIASLLETSRKKNQDCLPLSTRAGLSIVKAAKAVAFLEGRNYVTADDVQQIFIPVTGHRLGGMYGLRKGREWAQQIQNATTVPT